MKHYRHLTGPESEPGTPGDAPFDGPRGRGRRPGGPRRRRDDFPAPEGAFEERRGRRGGRGPYDGGPYGEDFAGRSEFHRHPHGPGGRGPGGGRGRDRRGGRAGRGDVRAAVLLLLAEQPRHGYELMQEIADRSGGVWRPSPGAIYPALNLLVDEGLVELSAEGGRRTASLTEAGRAHVSENAEALGNPWAEGAGRGPSAHRQLREAVETVGVAAHQVARTGTPEQVSSALATLESARRELYLILAGEAPSSATADATPEES